jgi:hypothetical protein
MEVVVLDHEPPAPAELEDLCESWERRSVAQFRQVHFLQPAANAQLAQHLPEVLQEMTAVGVEEINLPELAARNLPNNGAPVDLSRFVTRTTCRRPFMEFGFVSAARTCPDVEIRNASPVTELLGGSEVVGGVRHVVGVRTQNSDTHSADIVIDVSTALGTRPSPLSLRPWEASHLWNGRHTPDSSITVVTAREIRCPSIAATA